MTLLRVVLGALCAGMAFASLGGVVAGAQAAQRAALPISPIPPRRGPFDIHNFRRRQLAAGGEASGGDSGAAVDLRSTFASNAPAAGVTVYELARIMGTSVAMIEAITAHFSTRLTNRCSSASDAFVA